MREIVGASHRNLERVTELVTAHPALANVSYDWGFGDWESALGAASHVGNREIAAALLEHGARLDILMLQGRDKNAVRLTRTREHTFHPAGAPNVRVTFTVQDGAAIRVEIVEADWLVSAIRGK